ncbi:SRPBCC family protein [Archangium violaceum]|uniref:SRPBCC family protein n=1 Tax=Archangium violaceum TaxID=83451 RepID=UPI0019509C15|nr:SRPBCC family protein [Archangium violaceum]QRN96367.1 SRPBCC family protein [Archangium violaceum]
MAHFQTSLIVPRRIEDTFAFVSDFRHAPTWDPRTFEAQKLTEGPIGRGTRFMLVGGMFPKTALDGFELPPILLGQMQLPYEIDVYAPPRELVLFGETGFLRYRDHIQLSPEGENTRLVYTAEIELKGILDIGEPLLQAMFQRIGTAATQGIPDAVARGTPRDGG